MPVRPRLATVRPCSSGLGARLVDVRLTPDGETRLGGPATGVRVRAAVIRITAAAVLGSANDIGVTGLYSTLRDISNI